MKGCNTMELKKLTQEELEQMTYGEITELILSEKGNKMKIVDIFKKICTLLKMSDQEFEAKIADFFELVSTDKKFIILDKGYCDLRKKHTPKVVIEDEDSDDVEIDVDEEEVADEDKGIEEDQDDIFYDNTSDEDDTSEEDDELSDFLIVDDDEEAGM